MHVAPAKAKVQQINAKSYLCGALLHWHHTIFCQQYSVYLFTVKFELQEKVTLSPY